MKRFPRAKTIALAILVSAVGLAGVLAINHSSTPASQIAATANQQSPLTVDPEVDQGALQTCLANVGQNCPSTVPGLAACMAKSLQCNQAALDQRLKTYPPAIPPAPGATVISQDVAISYALGVPPGSNNKPLDTTAPSVAKQMSYSAAQAIIGGQGDPVISPARPVWVVEVHAPMPRFFKYGEKPSLATVFTVVLDGYTGYNIETGIGLALLDNKTG